MGAFIADTRERDRYLDVRYGEKKFRCYEKLETNEYSLVEFFKSGDGKDARRYMIIPQQAAEEIGKFLQGRPT